MTKEDLEHLEGLIIKATQSGKKETSGLVDMVLHRLEPAIEKSIAKNVNGKIDRLHEKIDTYIENDEQWKKDAEPVIKMGESLQGFSKVTLYFLGFLSLTTGAIFAVLKLLEKK